MIRPKNELTRAEARKLLEEKLGRTPEKPAVKSKYRNVPTVVDGIRFDSKAEAAHFHEIVRLHLAGEVTSYLRQVPFDLPGGIRYWADFVVFKANGCVEIHEVKGMWTDVARLKWRQVDFLYGQPRGAFKLVVIGKEP